MKSQKIQPMLAKVAQKPFSDPNWLFEIKWDGYRAIVEIENDKVELFSRYHHSFNERYPEIVETLKKIKTNAVLDGEIVAIDKNGLSQFQLLQNYLTNPKVNLCYCVFDILSLGGRNLTELPLIQRKQILKKMMPKLKNVKFSDYIENDGLAFFEAARKKGVEGIIAKKKNSHYELGKRSSSWLKIKAVLEQEVVIGGFTKPQGQRKYFGALLLGVYEKGKLKYIGGCGTGFDDKTLKNLNQKFSKIRQKEPSFVNPPKLDNVQWLKPKLVCQIKFQEWTNDEMIRQAVFLGLRDDKKPKEIVAER